MKCLLVSLAVLLGSSFSPIGQAGPNHLENGEFEFGALSWEQQPLPLPLEPIPNWPSTPQDPGNRLRVVSLSGNNAANPLQNNEIAWGISQSVDLRPIDWRRAVDDGQVTARLSANLNGESNSAVPIQGMLTLSSEIDGTETVALQLAFMLDGDLSTWESSETDAVTLPSGTRTLTASILFDPTSDDSAQGYIDDVRLSLTGIEEVVEDRLSFPGAMPSDPYRFGFLGSPLTKPALERGFVATVSSTEFTVENREINLTENEPVVKQHGWPYSVQFVSGVAEGFLLDVVDVPSNEILVLSADLSELGVRPGDAYVLREKQTLGDVFGSKNEIGLRSNVPRDPTLSWLITRRGKRFFYSRYFFKVSGLGPDYQWQSLGVDFIEDQSGTHFPHPFRFIMQGREAEEKVFPVYGVPFDHPVVIPIHTGFNLLSRIALDEAGMTLGTSGLAGSMLEGVSHASSDVVWLPREDGTFDRYFVKAGGLGGNGWRWVRSPWSDASAVSLTRAFFLQRRGAPTTVRLPVEPVKDR